MDDCPSMSSLPNFGQNSRLNREPFAPTARLSWCKVENVANPRDEESMIRSLRRLKSERLSRVELRLDQSELHYRDSRSRG